MQGAKERKLCCHIVRMWSIKYLPPQSTSVCGRRVELSELELELKGMLVLAGQKVKRKQKPFKKSERQSSMCTGANIESSHKLAHGQRHRNPEKQNSHLALRVQLAEGAHRPPVLLQHRAHPRVRRQRLQNFPGGFFLGQPREGLDALEPAVVEREVCHTEDSASNG